MRATCLKEQRVTSSCCIIFTLQLYSLYSLKGGLLIYAALMSLPSKYKLYSGGNYYSSKSAFTNSLLFFSKQSCDKQMESWDLADLSL